MKTFNNFINETSRELHNLGKSERRNEHDYIMSVNPFIERDGKLSDDMVNSYTTQLTSKLKECGVFLGACCVFKSEVKNYNFYELAIQVKSANSYGLQLWCKDKSKNIFDESDDIIIKGHNNLNDIYFTFGLCLTRDMSAYVYDEGHKKIYIRDEHSYMEAVAKMRKAISILDGIDVKKLPVVDLDAM